MTDLKIENFHPKNKDVLLERLDPSQFFSSSGLVLNIDDTNMDVQYFKVLRKAPEVTSVNVNDVVVMSWTRITLPFEMDNKLVGITAEDEILAVVE